MSAIPLGRLRREFPKWREDRRYRPLGVLPFLLPNLAELWPNHAEELQGIFAPIDSQYALQPAESLWYKPFADWTTDDWQHPEHKSLYWDIRTGAVTTYPGVRNRPTEWPSREAADR
ncbi:MAG: hypothetical protein KIT09_14135 [Bryobacteraceae bacterium]|nr:hypothetical protein [Bryobacteraceae bacterium]